MPRPETLIPAPWSGSQAPPPRLVVPLQDLGRDDVAVAGGKGANLGELVRAGFAVPDGFVITTAAYRLIVPAVAHLADRVPEDLPALRAKFDDVPVPEQLQAAVVEAYGVLGGGAVSVRSSATAEDLPGAAFAGQQDTFLNVTGEEAVLAAVRRCWGSLWTDRAVAYHRSRGLELADAQMAVVVQRMVQAETAGVLFTANPVTGDRAQVVVDASSGLGEAVVSGLVTPDHYVLDHRGVLQEWTAGDRQVVIRSAAGGGTTSEHQETGSAVRLPDRVLAELARLGTRVADHFGAPQDVEWAIASQIWLLQARPMTALPPPPVRLNAVQRKLLAMLVEYFPFRPYPIDMTTWLPYGPAGRMADVARTFGVVGVFEHLVHEDHGVVDRLDPPRPRLTRDAWGTPRRVIRAARRYDPAQWTADPRFSGFLAAVRALDAQDVTTASWSRLISIPRQALAVVEPLAALRIDYLPAVGLALVRLSAVLVLLRRRQLRADLIAGAHTRTRDLNQALEALADWVRADRDLAAAVDALAVDPAQFPDFWSELRTFAAEYGHRETATATLVTPPTLGEDQRALLGLLKVLAAHPPANRGDRAHQTLDQLLDAPALRRPALRRLVRQWVEAARTGIAFREDSHFYLTLPLPVLRRSLLEIGRRLQGAGVLGAPEEVFHLRLGELEGIEDLDRLSEPHRARLAHAVRERVARRAELAGVPLIDPTLVFPTRRRSAGTALVSGTPASAGRAAGPVRIVRTPGEFGRLETGDVLVCPYTNPAWTPLFQRAAAVVVDAGGLGSHAAIVAREYGIPAVMGTRTGTTALRDGQRVIVDGSAGQVLPDDRPAPE